VARRDVDVRHLGRAAHGRLLCDASTGKVSVLPDLRAAFGQTGLRGYRRIAAAAHAWLVANGVPCLAPEVLPNDLYADASHPLADGYRSLAGRLLADAAFREFAEAPRGRQ